jgi:multidrug resistance efflux pump
MMKTRALALALLLPAAIATAAPKELPARSLKETPLPDAPSLLDVGGPVPEILPAPEILADSVDASKPGASGKSSAQAKAALNDAASEVRRKSRLYKQGIVAKVELERAGLEVRRAAAAYRAALSREARARADRQRAARSEGKISATEEAEAEAEARVAEAEAQTASAEYEQERLAAARLNLERQQKLLAVGAGSRAMVSRAIAELRKLEMAAR